MSSRARSSGSSPGRELTAQPIDLELAERALQDLHPADRARDPAAADPGGDRRATSRSRPATWYRRAARGRSRPRATSRCTSSASARALPGQDRRDLRGRDHTTVLHGIKKVEGEMRARDTRVPAGPGPHPHHPAAAFGGPHEPVENPGTGGGVRCTQALAPGPGAQRSPQSVHMSEAACYAGRTVALPTFPQHLLLPSCQRDLRATGGGHVEVPV